MKANFINRIKFMQGCMFRFVIVLVLITASIFIGNAFSQVGEMNSEVTSEFVYDAIASTPSPPSDSAEYADTAGYLLKHYELVNRTIYIDPTGNDVSGDGSISLPFATLLRAFQDIKDIINQEIVITIHANAGSYTWDSYSIEDEIYRIVRLDNSEIVIESDMTLLTSGFTLTPQNPEGYIYNVSGATFTANEYQDKYLLVGTSYFPIAHNSTNTINAMIGCAASTSIYEPSATFTFNNEHFILESTFAEAADQSITIQHLKFSYAGNLIIKWSQYVKLLECTFNMTSLQIDDNSKVTKDITRCNIIATGSYGMQLKTNSQADLFRECMIRKSGTKGGDAIRIPHHIIHMNGLYMYNFTNGIRYYGGTVFSRFAKGNIIFDNCTNAFYLQNNSYFTQDRTDISVYLDNVDYVFTNDPAFIGFTGVYINNIVGTPNIDYLGSTLQGYGYINLERNININIPDIRREVYENTITVAKTGGQFTNIKAAMESITDNSLLNRYTIRVNPGTYIENNPIKMKDYVSLISEGGLAITYIAAQNSGNLFEFDTLSLINGFTVFGADVAFRFDSLGGNRVSNILVNSCDTGFVASVNGSNTYINDVLFRSQTSAIDIGYHLTGGNIEINNTSVYSQDTVGKLFYLSGNGTISTINSASTFSAQLDTFLLATDTARCVINTSSVVSAKDVLVSQNTADVRYNGCSFFRTQNHCISGNGDLAGYSNSDANDDALVIRGQELHVGDPRQGFEVCVGEGDSYNSCMLVYEYNGSTYTNVTDSAISADGLNVEFPNTSVNTAIYIASNIDTIIHHGIKLAMTDSLTIGSGEVVAEYWNGTAWTEFNGMVTDADAPYAPRAKAYFEQNQNTHIRYSIAMCNGDWYTNDPVSYGENKKWIRFRIATTITSSPKIDQIKLHTSRFEINADGFTESFGNARNSQLLPLGIGTGSPIEGNMQSQDIYVDENIGVGFQNNRFTATADILGFPVNYPDNIDTGSPVNIVWSGRYATGGTVQWTLRWKVVKPGDNLYTTEPAASGASGSVVINATATAGINELFKATIDVSEAIPTRSGAFGDQLWFTIQPTTLPGNFDITNIGAAYFTWGEGGHY